jgi:ferric-dicitrate binding protein FerR (iron transport regulator)
VNDVTIRVLGTSFNVKTTKGNTAVIVESGAVEVTKGKEVIQLKQHERAVIGTAQKELQKESSEDELYNYYRTNLIVCNKTPLWKLVELFNEVYGVNIVIGDSSKREVPITTTFSVTSLEDNLKIIAETCQLQVTKTDSEILLK